MLSRSCLRVVRRVPALHRATSTSSSSSSSSSAHQSTIKRNAIVAGFLVAASATVYYFESKQLGVIGGSSKSREPEFTVSVNTRGGVKSYNFQRKTDAEIEAMFHAHEASKSLDRKGNPVVRWDTNYVASNEPCEDRSAVDVVPRGPERSSWGFLTGGSAGADHPGKRDLVFLSVIDGHAGDATSQLLSRTLHPTLTVSLAALQAGIVPGVSWYTKVFDALTWAKTWSPDNISRTLQSAFVALDDNITWTPIQMLPSVMTASVDNEARAKFVAMAGPAASGAVVSTAMVDAENNDLYVAVTGDCRAVAGWQAADGSWRCDTLTEDQMGDNPKEVARMRAEHPADEADTVIRNGRVQGGLQPTRAFGDSVYKWTQAQGDAIASVFKAEGVKPRAGRSWNFTPPYVTAEPVVTHRRLDGAEGEKLRFVVMATDGLWDMITSEEATLLVASYLDGARRPDVSKKALAAAYNVSTTEPRPYPEEAMPGSQSRSDGYWAFEDSNAATHLIRNALGGADRKYRGELLSLHGKVSRYMRDDCTVTVVFFDDK